MYIFIRVVHAEIQTGIIGVQGVLKNVNGTKIQNLSVMTGWIKLHRNILGWEWYNDPNTSRLFIHLLLKANRKIKEWHGIELSPGQLITGRKTLANELNLSQRQIRTSLSRLETTNEIAIKTTNKFSIITICNWDSYQSTEEDERPTKRPTKSPTNDHKQEDKNKEKNNISVKFEAFRKEYPGTKGGLKKELDNFLKKNSPDVVELLLPALKKEIDYKKRLLKETGFSQAWKNLSTWINKECWEQEFPAIIPTKNGLSEKIFEPAKGLKR